MDLAQDTPRIATAAKPIPTARLVGIWRLGEALYRSPQSQLFAAQPAAASSPRYDYALRTIDEINVAGQAFVSLTRFVAAANVCRHPNLIAVLDAATEGAQPFIIMPRLYGQTLSGWMINTKVQPLPIALWLIRQAAQALEAMHQAGWTHGDVKPDNLHLNDRGHLTLIDLGFARRCRERSDSFIGTIKYAAPELISNLSSFIASPAADIYAIGKVLLELLAWCSPTARNQILLEPIADLIANMLDDDPTLRPTATSLVNQLLRLELETLGEHIQPKLSPARRAA